MSSRQKLVECLGGPYNGESMDTRVGRGGHTTVFTSKGMIGRYVLQSRTIKPKFIWESIPPDER